MALSYGWTEAGRLYWNVVELSKYGNLILIYMTIFYIPVLYEQVDDSIPPDVKWNVYLFKKQIHTNVFYV